MTLGVQVIAAVLAKSGVSLIEKRCFCPLISAWSLLGLTRKIIKRKGFKVVYRLTEEQRGPMEINVQEVCRFSVARGVTTLPDHEFETEGEIWEG